MFIQAVRLFIGGMGVKFESLIKEQAHYLSFLIALVAMLGSLYFSEILHYQACTYCWYARILMYPLVIILGIAAVRKDESQCLYVLPFTILGMCMTTYHYLTQKLPSLISTSGACGLIPCDTIYINWFGFITIPLLAFTAFTLIFVLQFSLWRVTRKR